MHDFLKYRHFHSIHSYVDITLHLLTSFDFVEGGKNNTLGWLQDVLFHLTVVYCYLNQSLKYG